MRFTSTPIVPFALLNAVFAGVAVSKPTFNQDSVSQRDSVNIEKRVDNASLTFYSFPQGSVGACGSAISPNDFAVALNSAQWNSGISCFKTITITAKGKTTQARIVDQCVTCPTNGLDLSPALFQFFAPLSDGQIFGTWNFV